MTIPFYLSVYFHEEESRSSVTINAIVDICFLIDILVTFNTAVPVSQVREIDDRKEIARIYLRKWFWIDVLVTMPFDMIISFYNPSYSSYASLAKFIRIMKIVRLIRLVKLVKVAKDRKRMVALLSSSI